MKAPGSIPLRILLPAILAAAFLADLAARFMGPPSALFCRACEAAELNRTASPGLFTPDFIYDNDRCYGDLADLANLPSMRQYHREFFTTDHFGFRNTPVNATRPASTIIFGDSYTAGSGLSDYETLPSQLASIRGDGVYNGGGVFGAGCWQRMEQVIERLRLKHGVVIYEHAARYDAPSDVGAFEDSPVDRTTGNELLVVLTPDKYGVYSSLVDQREGLPPAPVLTGLAANLKEAGVPVVDLTAALRDQAASLLAQGRYNYAVDHTHWNSAGVRRAAETLSESISVAMQAYLIPIAR